ncbi:phage protease [Roseomonas genomospecies 6]|nr:phage protease [Roseomonas genomospecies 6]
MKTLRPFLPDLDAGALVALASSSDVAVCAATLTDLSPVDGQAPEWVQLLPAGTFAPNDGRAPWSMKDPAAVIAASMAAAPKGLLAIDYDHAADLAAPKGGAAPAAGWITTLDARPDGIWAKVEWTPAGAKAIAAREYRFISPSFLHGKGDRAVTRIIGAGLVNRPALSQLSALASSQGDTMDPVLKAVLDALGCPPNADQATALAAVATLKAGTAPAALCSAVGVAADATPDQIVASVKTLKAAADGVKAIAAAAGLGADATADQIAASVKTLKTNATAATLLETQVTALAAKVQALEGDKLGAEVDKVIAEGKFVPAQRADLLALAAADKAAFDRLTANAVPVLKAGEQGGVKPAPGELSAEDKAVCAAMGLSAEDFKKSLAAQSGKEG